MKKILLLFIILCIPAHAIKAVTQQEHNNFMKSLKLSKKQTQKIEIIESNYNKKNVELNSMILLKNMQIAQLRTSQSNYGYIGELNNEIKALEKRRYDYNMQKNKDILATLNWIQKAKYREYISRIY
ncbi:MAG: hypothetical protein IJ877_07470 [Candidatus Gastranaerophilales bacterium]|nr:hypothetical protein [Candidatus Gastranaerophilales bacterium]